MSRRFSQVPLSLWDKPEFKALSDAAARALLYCWSGQHSTSAGIGVVKDGYAVADLGWTADKWKVAREEVEAAGLIRRDAETQTVFIPGYLLSNRPSNPKHRSAITSQIVSIQCAELKAMAENELAGAVAPLGKPSLEVVSGVSPQLKAMAQQKGWAA